MRNQTIFNELFLSGLSDLPSLQLPLFLFVFLIYVLTLLWNLLIIALIVHISHLHVPMYFFLGNLAVLDLCVSTVTVPRMLFDFHSRSRKITVAACITQVFFFLFFATSEIILLAVMSYDRYTAICQPLYYVQIMSWKVCRQLALIVWCLGFTSSLVHSLCALKMKFCDLPTIESFFCDLPKLFQISCSDISMNILLNFLLGGFVSAASLILTFLPYVFILTTVLKMQGKGSRSKAFSTCTSHLTVVFIYYGSGMFNYFQPSSGQHFAGGKVLSIFYAVILPLLNPLIYSMRNHDFRTAFQSILKKLVPTTMKNPSI